MKRYKRAMWFDDIDTLKPTMKTLYHYDNVIVIVYDRQYIAVKYDDIKKLWVTC